MDWNGLPILIFGSAGMSKDAFYLIKDINENSNIDTFNLLGFIQNHPKEIGNTVADGYKVVTTEDSLEVFASGYNTLGLVIPMATPEVKERIFNSVKHIKNIVFPNLIHPNVTLTRNAIYLGIGNLIATGARLSSNVKIGDFNLINVNATIGHDVTIKSFTTINPGANISGNILINRNCLIGTGAQILQGLTLGDNSTVGAGAVVLRNVANKETVVGVPAKSI